MKITKIDLAAVLVLLALSALFMINADTGVKKLYLITEEGKAQVPLTDDTITLKDGHIVIEVTKDGARFTENDCPNKICIKEGWVDKCGQSAVCVPNRVAIVMECSGAEYDAVSQ